MSVKDLNKQIIVSSGLTGCIIFTMDFDDYIRSPQAIDFFNFKLSELIEDEEGALIKVGYKN